MTDTTVVIKTIGRPTLKDAIRSAKREGFKTIVISDGVKADPKGADRFIQLGRQWGYYGGMAANVGAALADTEFITFLDDDDQFAAGAGDIIRAKLKESPSVDIWAAGVRFNTRIEVYDQNTKETVRDSTDLCLNGDLGVVPGNVAMPTYRASIFSKVPFMDNIPEDQLNLTDFIHIKTCEDLGYSIDWFGEVIYLVRPEVGGINGRGS
jgi:glycosyltransferase involved in cell wall biosynthesis